MLNHSMLASLVMSVQNDHQFWFPSPHDDDVSDEEAEGNSESGPSGNTDE